MRRHDPTHSLRQAGATVRRLTVLATLLGGLLVRPAFAIVFQTTAAQTAGHGAGQAYLDGEARLVATLSDHTAAGCSGSLLLGGRYVLTAAHCVTGSSGTLTASNIALDFANAGINLSATNYVVDPVWNGSLTHGGDLALIKLNTPISSIAGYPLYTASSAVGQVVTLAGYGNTGVGSTGYVSGTFGSLYYGQNQYDGVFSNVPTVYGFDFDAYGNSTFNIFGGNAVGPNEVMTAPGDSGGGALLNVGGIWQLVGVHDFIGCLPANCTPNSSFGQFGGDTSIYADAGWIDSALGLPEPGSLMLMGAGLAAIGMVRRRSGAVP